MNEESQVINGWKYGCICEGQMDDRWMDSGWWMVAVWHYRSLVELHLPLCEIWKLLEGID